MSEYVWRNGESYGTTVRFPDGEVLTSADSARSPFRGWSWLPLVDGEDQMGVVELALHDRARQAYTANRTYLAIPAPTAAQNTAQVRALTRQVQALLRLGPLRDLLADEAVD